MTADAAATVQVYRVFIHASPERVWAAITEPNHTVRYFHGARVENTPSRHHSLGPSGETWGDGAILEWDPPRRLVHEWRSLYDPELAKEPASRVTWEIELAEAGVCMLTVVHDHLEGAPKTAASVSGPGWSFVVSSLKTYLETGDPLPTD